MSEETEIPVIELRHVSCRRGEGLLEDVSLKLAARQLHWLHGDTGAPLLLRVMSLLDSVDAGEVLLGGHAIHRLDETIRTILRARRFGFVFAAPYLLPSMCTAENIAMPLFKVLDLADDEARVRTEKALRFAALEEVATTEVGELSRLDQQRVSIARAIAHGPDVLVLDRIDEGFTPAESAELLAMARRARTELGLTVIVAPAGEPHPVDGESQWTVSAGRVERLPSTTTSIEDQPS